jgi:hypothetical protein
VTGLTDRAHSTAIATVAVIGSIVAGWAPPVVSPISRARPCACKGIAEVLTGGERHAAGQQVDRPAEVAGAGQVSQAPDLPGLRARLPGYATATPDVIQRRFPETPGQITTASEVITVRLERRAYSPILRKAGLPATTVPWLGNRTHRYEFT